MKSLTALLLVAVLATACSTGGGPPPGVQPITASGTYRHAPSSFAFPETFGKFRRVEIFQFDSSGRDVGVGYSLEESDVQVELTLYVYPPLRGADGNTLPLSTAFEHEKAAVLTHHVDAIVSPPWTPPQTQNDEPTPGNAVTFRFTENFAGKHQKLESMLYLFEYDGWLVKYRVTYPVAQGQFANMLSQIFVSAFRWRGAA